MPILVAGICDLERERGCSSYRHRMLIARYLRSRRSGHRFRAEVNRRATAISIVDEQLELYVAVEIARARWNGDCGGVHYSPSLRCLDLGLKLKDLETLSLREI